MKLLLKHILILALIMLVTAFTGPDNTYKLTHSLRLDADFIRSDELGNVFVVKDNKLTKYGRDGKKLHAYTNMYAGDISFVDTQDPFKILVFYQAFSQIDFLDRTLSLSSSSIDLNQINMGLVTLACASYQGAFWVYDPINFELNRIDQSLKISEQSGNLQQVTGYTLQPNYMLERDNSLYLNDPNIGILIFDKYGSYYKTIPILGLTSFQVFDRKIIYVQDNEISIYDTKLNEVNTTSTPEDDARSISVCLSTKPQMLYLLDDAELHFYQMN